MSIRTSLSTIFVLSFAIMVVCSISFYFSLTGILLLQKQSERSHEQLTLYITLADDMSRYMREAAEASLGAADHAELVTAADLTRRDLLAIDELKKSWIEEARLGGSLADLEEDFEQMPQIRASLEAVFAGMNEVVRLADAEGGGKVANEYFVRVPEHEFEEGFVPRVRISIENARRDVVRNTIEAHRLGDQVKLKAGALLAGALVTLIILLGSLLRALGSGVRSLVHGSQRLALGQLDFRLPDLGKHEFGQLGVAFNHMASRLEEAQESRLRLEKLAAVGQLAASIGHDLRNPLAAIRNAIHYIKKRLAGTEVTKDPRVEQFVKLIEKEVAACTGIVSDLLDFARERKLMLSSCPLAPLVDDAMSVVQAPAHVRLQNDVPAEMPIPNLDRGQFRQVLVNLIQNGAEGIPETREGWVRVTARVTDEEVSISVTDNGSGIREDNLQHIFEPLFSTKHKGTGLGLAIAAGIVRRHGGSIEIKTEIGAGTTFTVRLPTALSTGVPLNASVSGDSTEHANI